MKLRFWMAIAAAVMAKAADVPGPVTFYKDVLPDARIESFEFVKRVLPRFRREPICRAELFSEGRPQIHH